MPDRTPPPGGTNPPPPPRRDGGSAEDIDTTMPRRRRGSRAESHPPTQADSLPDIDPTVPRRPTRPSAVAPPTAGPPARAQRTAPPPTDPLLNSGRGTHPATAVASGRHITAGEELGKFVLGDILGQGGMGVVINAQDRKLDRALAIKRIRDSNDREAIAQFVEEAQITGQLEHPNIVPVHELGEDDAGRPWMAMKLVQGQTLSELVKTWRDAIEAGGSARLTGSAIARMLDIVRKVADAIAFAHDRGVIHRDLKTENVMLGAFGEVLVMDWGLAKPLGQADRPRPAGGGRMALSGGGGAGESGRATAPGVRVARRMESSSALTMDGEVFGTPAFMPPEQARGDVDDVGPASDQFALGGILYHMLTLEEPYREGSLDKTLFAARQRKLLPPRQRAPQRGIPKELSAIVMKAMAARPRDRYASVADFMADCTAWQAHERTSAYRAAPWEHFGKWFRRHPTMGITGLTSVFMLLVFGSLALSLESSRQLEQERAALAEAQEHAAAIALAVRTRDYHSLQLATGTQLVADRASFIDRFLGDWTAWEKKTREA
ncbi:MAG: protein kinase, partial [Planctomycetota bacterium]